MYLIDDDDPHELGDYRQFGGEIRGTALHFPDDESLEKYLAYKDAREKEGE